MLREIFNPKLSDRRSEGERFVPPDRSYAYVTDLRNLIEEEAEIKQQRKDHFCSESFVIGVAGPLFPYSWNASLGGTQLPTDRLHVLPGYKAQHLVENVLAGVVPIFDKSTEDGSRYRIYHLDCLEVRTMCEHGSREVIGAVFSRRPVPVAASSSHISENERVIKVTEYVEYISDAQFVETTDAKAHASLPVLCPNGTQQQALQRLAATLSPPCRFYVVLETEKGNLILTEKLKDGSVTWTENPRDLEIRNSKAKVMRSAEYQEDLGTALRVFKNIRARDVVPGREVRDAADADVKRYAHGMYAKAIQLGADSCAATAPRWGDDWDDTEWHDEA